MKWSKFNIWRKSSKGYYILFNYYTNNTILIIPELYKIIRTTKNASELSYIHKELFDSLQSRKFIINDDIDESSVVELEICNKLASHRIYNLTINPTLDCNLRCWYCYEKHTKKGFISTEIKKGIVSFVDTITNEDKLEILNLNFFEGEPLMFYNKAVIPLIKEIKNICTTKNKKLVLHFTSNGVLMSEKFIDSLSTIINQANFQIAFDGGRNVHDQTKYLHNGHGTYAIVLQNINYALSKGYTFNIRCNYTKDNIESFKDLIDDVIKLSNFNTNSLYFSLQKVWQAEYTSELEEKVDKLGSIIKDLGIDINIATKEIPDFCYADYCDSLVFNYDGSIFKCTARDFNDLNKIGILNRDGTIDFEYGKAKQYSQMPFFDDCYTCSLLPICRICIQARIEHLKEKHCFRHIPETDKQKQINNYFEAHCKDYL